MINKCSFKILTLNFSFVISGCVVIAPQEVGIDTLKKMLDAVGRLTVGMKRDYEINENYENTNIEEFRIFR
jgi:hypothetical protein